MLVLNNWLINVFLVICFVNVLFSISFLVWCKMFLDEQDMVDFDLCDVLVDMIVCEIFFSEFFEEFRWVGKMLF